MFFPYEFDPAAAAFVRLVGVRRDRDGVTIDGDDLVATFGFLHLRTPVSNIVQATPTGPYSAIKAIGPRLSFADRGLTFGTTTRAGVCLEFATPISPVIGLWDHPGLTVTVSDPARLCSALETSP